MAVVPLVLPDLGGVGHSVHPTPLRWLREDGDCRAREPLACSWLEIRSRATRKPLFAEERRDIQVVVAAPRAGRFRRARDVMPDDGGWASLLASKQHVWPAGTVVGWLETDEVASDQAQSLAWMLLAGQRVVELADVRGTIMSGWHDRQRGWFAPDGDTHEFSTVTSLGVCELMGVMLGDQRGFFEWFAECPGPVQLIHYPDHLAVPAAPLLRSKLETSARSRAEIYAELTRWWHQLFASTAARPQHTPPVESSLDDLAMAAHVMASATVGSPFDRPQVLWDGVLRECTGRHALLLSLHSEGAVVVKHRRTGYVLAFHAHRIADFGAAFVAWLRSEFDQVVRSIDDVERDLAAVVALARERGVTDILVLNMMSGSLAGTDCFAPLDDKTFDGMLRARQLDVMLYKLARELDLSIIDVDDLGAQLGANHFMTDMVHQYAPMEVAVRDEILRVLRERGVPGL